MSVDINSSNAVPLTSAPQSPLQRLTSLFVQLFERHTPDPYMLAVGLTILTGILAAVLAPKGSVRFGLVKGMYRLRTCKSQPLKMRPMRRKRRDHEPWPRKLEEAWVLNLIFVVAGIAALGLVWHQNGFSLDLNSVIFLFLITLCQCNQ
jgi:short subunit fatty acids transporter